MPQEFQLTSQWRALRGTRAVILHQCCFSLTADLHSALLLWKGDMLDARQALPRIWSLCVLDIWELMLCFIKCQMWLLPYICMQKGLGTSRQHVPGFLFVNLFLTTRCLQCKFSGIFIWIAVICAEFAPALQKNKLIPFSYEVKAVYGQSTGLALPISLPWSTKRFLCHYLSFQCNRSPSLKWGEISISCLNWFWTP